MIKDRESGIAFGFFMIILFLVVATIAFVIIFGPMMNSFNNDVVNPGIESGKVSAQTIEAVKWNEASAALIPIVALLGSFVFVVVRAIYRKKMPGEDF